MPVGTGTGLAGVGAAEGAIYVETIPFNETRDYAKKVLANAMFYRAQLGFAMWR
jgi:soluble lytic murein transglycosylase-like protein